MQGVSSDLIFDLGMHRGEDAAYYLARGFRVVGVECEPDHVRHLRQRFAREIADGRLVLVDRAIADHTGTVTFYRNKNISVWGTISPAWADRNIRAGTAVEEIIVEAIAPDVLFRQYGIPFYLKVDIEGADMLVVEVLAQFDARPSYLSVEAEEVSFDRLRRDFATMGALGYHQFKLSPQHHVARQRVPAASPHGTMIDWTFEDGSSGLFGEDIDGPWLDDHQALVTYQAPFVLYDLERALGSGLLQGSFPNFLNQYGYECGWYDTHARHSSIVHHSPTK
jgi:FkbM family methyltransferase